MAGVMVRGGPMDLNSITPQDFVYLVQLLFEAEGNMPVRLEARAHDVGVDIAISDPSLNGKRAVVECKVGEAFGGLSALMSQAEQLERTRDYLEADLAYLVTSRQVAQKDREYIDKHTPIIFWDATDIADLLAKHPAVCETFENHLAEVGRHGRLVLNVDPIATRSKVLSDKLKALPSGRDHWRDYEDLGIEIFNFLFFPALGIPAVQSTSEDGLDRRDAIYPIQDKDGYWQLLRREFTTRFVVAEFKNYASAIDQKGVESIKEYLHAIALRNFGIFCSRQPVSESAATARRRAWMEGKKIVMLTDIEVLEMLESKANSTDPTDVIEHQLQAFLIRLTP
jgi:hypothetical protein